MPLPQLAMLWRIASVGRILALLVVGAIQWVHAQGNPSVVAADAALQEVVGLRKQGEALAAMGRWDLAQSALQASLLASVRTAAGKALPDTMLALSQLHALRGQEAVATFWAKQAVKQVAQRDGLAPLVPGEADPLFEALEDLLARQGRLVELEQVLQARKGRELYEDLAILQVEQQATDRLSLTAMEHTAEQQLQAALQDAARETSVQPPRYERGRTRSGF